MNQKLIIFLICLLPTLNGFSQISWNIQAGMNLSRISGYGDVDMKPGYQFGAGMDYYFNEHWGIQSSLMLISKGYGDKGNYYFPEGIENPAGLKSYDYTVNRVYVEMPVMLTYRFDISRDIKMVLSEGGFIGYGVDGRYKNKNTLEDGSIMKESSYSFPSGVERFDTGIRAGAALEYKNRYIFGLSGEWGLKSASGNDKNQTCGITLGYRF